MENDNICPKCKENMRVVGDKMICPSCLYQYALPKSVLTYDELLKLHQTDQDEIQELKKQLALLTERDYKG